MCDATFRTTMVTRAAALSFCVLLAACGGGGGGGSDASGGGGGSDGGGGPVTISPATINVPIGGRTQFTLSPAQGATWSVGDVPGGNDTVGHISLIGGYTAPFVIPSASTAVPNGDPDPTVTIAASAATNTATVTLVRRFIDDGPLNICASSPSVCGPSAIIAPDLNGDGFADLVTANSENGTISVVMRSGASSFVNPIPAPLQLGGSTSSAPEALVAGLFNTDQFLDLVVAEAEHNLTLAPVVRTWLGEGDGTFPNSGKQSLELPLGRSPLSIGAGHFNADQKLDVVVADFLTDTLTVLFGDGSGSFPTPTVLPLSDGILSASPLGIAVANFNGDLYDDIAVANNAADTVMVFIADGGGGFSAAQTYPIIGNPSAIAATDLNLDGSPDLAVSTTSGGLVLILNKGVLAAATTFNAPGTPYPAGAQPVAVAAGDLNQDQPDDLVVVNLLDETLVVYLGHGDGTLTVSETYTVGSAPQAVAVGDFNGDSFPDLAVANGGDGTVTILRNRGQ